MKTENIGAAKKLIAELDSLNSEYKIWDSQLTKLSRLGYFYLYSDYHGARLDSHIDEQIFIDFRNNAMENLKAKITEIATQLSEL